MQLSEHANKKLGFALAEALHHDLPWFARAPGSAKGGMSSTLSMTRIGFEVIKIVEPGATLSQGKLRNIPSIYIYISVRPRQILVVYGFDLALKSDRSSPIMSIGPWVLAHAK